MYDFIFCDTKPAFTPLNIAMCTLPPSTTSVQIPTTLLSITLERQKTCPASHSLPSHVKGLLYNIHNVCLQFEMLHLGKIRSSDADPMSFDCLHIGKLLLSPFADDMADNSYPKDYMYESCRLAAVISWNLMYGTIPLSATENQQHVSELKAALSNIDSAYWIRVAPEAYIWVCLTGASATAASDFFQRAWFITMGVPAIGTLGPEDQNAFKEGFAHFCWLSKILREKNNCKIKIQS
jgi:hypothetical protein